MMETASSGSNGARHCSQLSGSNSKVPASWWSHALPGQRERPACHPWDSKTRRLRAAIRARAGVGLPVQRSRLDPGRTIHYIGPRSPITVVNHGCCG
jgi:hypothetical protein